ncbi:MipA/OmpV family protein [Hydrogenophaga pseudoflava]|uniref:MltA-interacting protein n=1 Tax=Hydrogenophaga pseudoflava TaxID=47421 RepID=A0A4P6X5W3_HYDPS|nr:MipA/OmpV family protein [Hydrogenophaga pseudoflava]QBM29191.1 MltA-interacting protein precursor [Hydrogenophaga pseudoflava]
MNQIPHLSATFSTLFFAGSMLLSAGAFAQHGGPTDIDGSVWGVGLAAILESSPYRGVDDETKALPVVTFENRWVRVFGPGLEVKLGTVGDTALGLTATYSDNGFKASDSPFLSGMGERKNSAWLGLRGRHAFDWATMSSEISVDASDHSGGTKVRIGMERRFALGELGITPRLAATWIDREFTRYYYGVSTGEARPGRSAYSPDATVNTSAGVRLDYRLAPQQTLFLDLGVEVLGQQIRKSPLVDRRSVPEVRLGYLYRF